MPTVAVFRDELFERLGRTYTDKEFDELCFEFGVELDDVTSEAMEQEKEKGSADASASTEVQYKIDIPANRYDLLCIEGIVRAILVFLGKKEAPTYKIVEPKQRHVMKVHAETEQVRPFVVCAILRGITFTPQNYESFVALQEKLHQNICRRRTLVAIGTHDLGTVEGPFSYQARMPKDIKFVPLKQTKEFTAEELMTFYESDNHLKHYLDIIRNKPRYPVVLDAKDRVMSLPPIINSRHSRITLDTKDVFIECTATDLTKAKIVLDTMVTMFGEYCAAPFTVEPVTVEMPDKSTHTYPTLEQRTEHTDISYINSRLGIDIEAKEAAHLLSKMMLTATVAADGKSLNINVPPTRSDVLHPVDIVEDVGVAYGFNNIEPKLPATKTTGKEQPINKLTDFLRQEMAMAGFTEALTYSFNSWKENYDFLNHKQDPTEAVSVGNPATIEFEILRTRLIPGLLKTCAANQSLALPLKLFEVSDIVIQTDETYVKAKNERHFCAIYCGTTPGFESIHGLVDRFMQVLAVPVGDNGYTTHAQEDAMFLPNQSAAIQFRGATIGTMGVVHPSVLKNFGLPHVCSVVELTIEPFL